MDALLSRLSYSVNISVTFNKTLHDVPSGPNLYSNAPTSWEPGVRIRKSHPEKKLKKHCTKKLDRDSNLDLSSNPTTWELQYKQSRRDLQAYTVQFIWTIYLLTIT